MGSSWAASNADRRVEGWLMCTGAGSSPPQVESDNTTVSARVFDEDTEVTPAPQRGQTPGVRTAKNRSLQPAQYNVP
jgi:hypothetical protein